MGRSKDVTGFRLLLIFLFLFNLPLQAQGTKKQLKPDDYKLWGTMRPLGVSHKGNWIAYSMAYEEADTLSLKSTKNSRQYVFPNTRQGKFCFEKTFAYLLPDNTLRVLDLKNNRTQSIDKVSAFDFSADGDFLVTMFQDGAENITITTRKPDGSILETITEVMEYKWNPSKNSLLYAMKADGKSIVGVLDFSGNYQNKVVLTDENQHFKTLTWNLAGTSAAFYGITESGRGDRVYHYDFVSGIVKNIPDRVEVDSDPNLMLLVSDDGKKIFFGRPSEMAIDTSSISKHVQVWNGNDKLLYPARKHQYAKPRRQLLAMWQPEADEIVNISSDSISWVMLSENQEKALVANPTQYEPQYKRYADMDYYIFDINSKKQRLLLSKHSGQLSTIAISPDSEFVTYYSEGDWWMSRTDDLTKVNLTQGLDALWDNRAHDPGNELYVWGHAGWSADLKWSLYYDYFDIWAISPDGAIRRRLTKGREKNIRFRFDKSAATGTTAYNYAGYGVHTYDLSKTMFLSAQHMADGSRGYFSLSNGKAESVFFKESYADKLLISANGDAFLYVDQKFDSPPAIMFQTHRHSPRQKLVQSNKHHEKYLWGKSEIVEYTDNNGSPLHGALFYPAGYDPKLKYPMIVYIYDIVSRQRHLYVNPSFRNGIGFNVSNLTGNGYFVLFADIVHETGNPGGSAVDCVTKAVEAVTRNKSIDKDRIGLFGHSFGAYEVNYILTQTDIFAAGISGSGVSDPVAHYFTVNRDLPEAWRYENQQYRMGISYYDDQEAYHRNSPLVHAHRINTPLLLFSGAKDNNVRPSQSQAFYVALRRLKKRCILLMYPEEGHIFRTIEGQQDLSQRVLQWYDHFLKNSKSDWITDGTR